MGCGTSKAAAQPVQYVSAAQPVTEMHRECQPPHVTPKDAGVSFITEDKTAEVDQPAYNIEPGSAENLVVCADSSSVRQDFQPIDKQKQMVYNARSEESAGAGSMVQDQAGSFASAAVTHPDRHCAPSHGDSAQSTLAVLTPPENDHNIIQALPLQESSAEAARQEAEEVQPFQEADVIAAQEGAASPWACLQKTYSNVEEHVQSTTEGQLQQSNVEGLAAAKEDHHASAMGMIDQDGSNATMGQPTRQEPGAQVPSRVVAENAWGDTSARPAPAAPPAGVHRTPLNQSSAPASIPIQGLVVDDLGMEDVDEFETELAALQIAKLT